MHIFVIYIFTISFLNIFIMLNFNRLNLIQVILILCKWKLVLSLMRNKNKFIINIIIILYCVIVSWGNETISRKGLRTFGISFTKPLSMLLNKSKFMSIELFTREKEKERDRGREIPDLNRLFDNISCRTFWIEEEFFQLFEKENLIILKKRCERLEINRNDAII